MKHFTRAFFVLILSILFLPHSYAKTLYIHDNLRVDMRSGPSLEYRIIDFLRSGTKLEQLKESGDWILVSAGGKQGWIQSQYTSDQPIARDQLVAAFKQVDRYKKENEELKHELETTREELGGLKSDHTKMSSSTEKLQVELDRIQKVSRNAMATETAYRQLQEEAEMLKVDIEKLKVENVRLSEDNLKEGIQWGVGAVFLGIILAWLISKTTGKKRRSEW